MIPESVRLAMFGIILISRPAFAQSTQMTADDFRRQIDQIFIERRLENDRRIESLERHIVEEGRLQAAELQTVKVNIEDNVKFFSKQIENIMATITAVSLSAKEALAQANVNQQESIRAAFASAKEAVDKAAVATEKRFDSVNEFRGN